MFCKRRGKNKNELAIIQTENKMFGIISNGQNIGVKTEFEANCDLTTVLNWGKDHTASKVRLLTEVEIHEISSALPEDAEHEEIQAAAAFDIASLTGANANTIRTSLIEANTLTGISHKLLGAGIPAALINNFEQKSKSCHIKSEGCGSLQQVLCLYHFCVKTYSDDVLLYFSSQSSFAIVPGGKNIYIKNMPFGVEKSVIQDELWQERLQRRLGKLNGKKIRIYTNEEIPGLEDIIKQAFSPEEICTLSIENILADLVKIVAGNQKEQNFNLAKPPPKEKDPRSTGTVICLLLIGATFVALMFQFLQLRITFSTLNKTIEHKSNIQSRKKLYDSQIDSFKEKARKLQVLCDMVENKRHVDPGFLQVLNLLGRYRLKYTKINFLQQRANGILIVGETCYQPDLSKFLTHFEQELASRKLTLFSEGLRKNADGKLTFKCRVSHPTLMRISSSGVNK
jgi:hypothetical protein